MIRRGILLVLLVLACAPRMQALENKKLGIGVVIGAPSGFSIKYWKGSVAYQGTLGAGFGGGLAIGADYLMHSDAFANPRAPFYYGPGLFLGDVGFGGPKWSNNDLFLGARFLFGVDYIFPDHPFDIAFEMGPALLVAPSVGLGIELGIAFRFYP